MKEIVDARANEIRRKLAEHVARESSKGLRTGW